MLLLIDNYDSFTWNLVQAFGSIDPSLEPGRSLRVCRNDEISAGAIETIDHGKPPTHIVLSPGPCGPLEAGISVELIRRFAGRVPIFGVCLGHQCIGAAYGMTIERHPPVHGKTSSILHDGRGVFAGVPSPFEAARYHSLVVTAATIPEADGAWEVTARTSDGVVMGMRRVWKDAEKAALEGVQFHPESFMTPRGPALLRNFVAGKIAN